MRVNENVRASIVIPVLNAGKQMGSLLERLVSQTVVTEILIVDSGSTDETLRIAEGYGERIGILRIPEGSFDHGGTRDLGLRRTRGEIVLFLTQDALPVDDRYVERLLEAFSDGSAAAAFGRQIAYPDAPAYERLVRAFNYPEAGRVWGAEDIPKYGTKAFFFSDVCSAYRRSAYEAVGGFDAPISSNEDMMLAAKLLHAGFRLAYRPEAAVLHSHAYTLRQDFLRNVEIGRVMARYRERLAGSAPGAEGVRMVRFVGGTLLREGRIRELFVFLAHAAARYLGFRKGKRTVGAGERG